jgi:hypothetical protein
MAEKGEGRSIRALKEAAGLMAVLAARRGLQLGWRRVTGKEPPVNPDDRQVSLGQAVLWTVLLGAAITTARMIAIRYAAKLLPRWERQSAAQADREGTPAA